MYFLLSLTYAFGHHGANKNVVFSCREFEERALDKLVGMACEKYRVIISISFPDLI